jgi:tetratricopeptide (TPR) repeat protein
VCDADLDTLQSLVDKSLVRVREADRFWMLETIREYAAERLNQSGEAESMAQRHAEFFLALAESAGLSVEGIAAGRGLSGYGVVLPEQANLRAALDVFLAADRIELATRLVVALEQYWVTSSPAEGARLVAQMLERGDELPPELRVRAVRCLAGTTYILGDFETGTRAVGEALAQYRRLDDDWGAAHMLHRLSIEARRTGDSERARSLVDESRALDNSDFHEAGTALLLAQLAFDEGRHDEALEFADRSAALAQRINFVWWQANALQTASFYALKLDRADYALARLRGSVEICRSIHDRQGLVYGLTMLAWAAASGGQSERAGTLWGAVEAEAGRGHIGQWEDEREEYAGYVHAVAGPEFDSGRAAGSKMSLDQAVEYALSLH